MVGLIEGGNFADLQALAADSVRAQDFYKALEAGGGTDHALLTGGAALRRESLEASVLTVTQREEHFVFWKKVPKGKAISVVDEWTIQDAIGGVPGSSASGELTDLIESTGNYDRMTASVKYLKDKRRVTFEAERQSQNGLVGAVAKETDNGTKKLLTDADYLSWYGDDTCNSLEFNGFRKIMESFASAPAYRDHVIDLGGKSVSGNAREFIEAAALIWGQGNWGRASDYFCSAMVQADLDQKLDPAHRVSLRNTGTDITLGAPVKGLHTNFGDMATNIEPFIVEGGMPFVARGGQYALLVSNTVIAPASVAGVAAPNAASKFQAAHEGGYYYAAEAGSTEGGKRSSLVKSGQVAVAAGDGVTITITHGAGHNGSYFMLYRTNTDGANSNDNFREMKRIASSGGATTVHVDLNEDVPGTSFIAIQTMAEQAITFQRFFESTRFPLYPSNRTEIIWAQIMGGYLRVGKPQQHVLIKNVLPSGQAWRPFNA